MNQKKIKTLRANSDIRQDIVTFDSSVSSPSNIEETFLLQSAVTNAQGKAVISEVKNGTYSLEVLATDYNEVYNQTNLVVTSNKDVLINITPLYGVTIQVKNSSAANIEGAVVKLTPSNGIQETKNTDVNGQAIFTAVPGGVYTIEISKENYQTVSTAGVIEGGETVTFDYTLAIMPKLVQITSNQSNYQLDTTYKYVSMLVVGKGARSNGEANVVIGGGSGMVVYKKNLEILSGTFSAINVDFTNDTLVYLLPEVGSTSEDSYIEAGNGSGYYGGSTVQYWLNGISVLDQLDGYGSNGGGNGQTGSSASTYGGGGSNGNSDRLTGGLGGDGLFGYQGGLGGATTKGTVIPLTSIFGGNGKGGNAYYGSGTSRGGGAGGYGAGYGLDNQSSSDHKSYGAGGWNKTYGPGDGIVCLYYHNDPL